MLSKIIALSLGLSAVALADDSLLINGAGATFPYPLYSKWFSEYNKLHRNRKFNYQSIGSGGGIQQVTNKTVDFGASDAAMSDAELAKAGGDIVHIPTVLGSVVVSFNLPGVTELKLSADTLTSIFMGKITKWNDAALTKENPSLKLPDQAITVVHRSDGSGTTSIFTDYLAKVSPQWKEIVGAGKSVNWPIGLGAKGNEGVTGQIKQTPGSIGYVELAYANQNHLPMVNLRNKENVYVKPSIESTSAAAAGVSIPDDFRASLTNPVGKDAYPIAGFTWILVRRDQSDKAKGEALINFLWWAIHDGQKMAAPLDYAPLPEPVAKKVEVKLKSLTVQGKPVSIAAAH